MGNSDHRTPSVISDSPPKIDQEYLRKTLHSIKVAQAEQARIEAERTGASKMTARLVTVFGSIMTAAAIGAFVWMWDATATNQSQDSTLARIREIQTEHARGTGHAELDKETRETQRRVDGLERATQSIVKRLDRQDQQLETILDELRRVRRRGVR